jgi:hypothetical protein
MTNFNAFWQSGLFCLRTPFAFKVFTPLRSADGLLILESRLAG